MTHREFASLVAHLSDEMALAERHAPTMFGANRVGRAVFFALRPRGERLARWAVRRAMRRAGINPDRLGVATL